MLETDQYLNYTGPNLTKVILEDEDVTEKNVEILILKASTLNGKKLAKDTLLELPEKEAQGLIDGGKAKLNKG